MRAIVTSKHAWHSLRDESLNTIGAPYCPAMNEPDNASGNRSPRANTTVSASVSAATSSDCPSNSIAIFDAVWNRVSPAQRTLGTNPSPESCSCLLYTSDAADDLLCVDLGGRRIIKKKKKKQKTIK